MTSSHRRWHLGLWMLLAPVLALSLTKAILDRRTTTFVSGASPNVAGHRGAAGPQVGQGARP